MQTYTFYEGQLPAGFAPDFEPAIFNLSEFFMPQKKTGWLSFHILDYRASKVSASIHFALDGNVAKTPYRAPFGSVDCNEKINPRLLFDFLDFVEARLKESGIHEVYIKNPPRAYAPAVVSLLECFLLNLRYQIVESETGATIAVDNIAFADRVRHSELLRTRQAGKAGLRCRRIPAEQVDEVYRFISSRHEEKGYKLSISAAELRETVQRLPDRYLLLGVFDGERIAGASVSIRVKQHILYNFLVNHDKEYNHFSPAVLLMEGLYNYCHESGISLLDLGTSALGGIPNFSLLDFKLHLGGVPTTKFSFHKKI